MRKEAKTDLRSKDLSRSRFCQKFPLTNELY